MLARNVVSYQRTHLLVLLGRGSWQLPVAIVRFPRSGDPGELARILAVVAKAAVVAICCCSSSFCKRSCCYIIVIKAVLTKAVVEKAIVALAALAIKLSESWQLPVAIVRFLGSGDPGEARHTKQRGSIPWMEVRGKRGMIYQFSSFLTSRGAVLAKAVVEKAVVPPATLAIKLSKSPCSKQGHSKSVPHSRIPFSSALQVCSSPKDPSFHSSFCLSLVGLPPKSKLVGRLSLTPLLRWGSTINNIPSKKEIALSVLAQNVGSWKLPVAIVRFLRSSDPSEARHTKRCSSIPWMEVSGRRGLIYQFSSFFTSRGARILAVVAKAAIVAICCCSSSFCKSSCCYIIAIKAVLAKEVVEKVVVAPAALAIKLSERMYVEYEHAAIKLTGLRLAAAIVGNTCRFSSPLISINIACNQIEFRRIFLTGFRSCTSHSHYQNVSKQTSRYE
ncbi:hypothetical protein Tco_0804689 [Tanacetum coccineum]|uniref:Uncharacterized protein n=1 Tax=Tanacetum coccineum TaxID=301880 RepID=A0ABQ5A7L1_9ASTR